MSQTFGGHSVGNFIQNLILIGGLVVRGLLYGNSHLIRILRKKNYELFHLGECFAVV